MVNKLMKIKLKLLGYQESKNYLNVLSKEFSSFKDMADILLDIEIKNFVGLEHMDEDLRVETMQTFEYRLLTICQSMLTDMINEAIAANLEEDLAA